MQTSSTHTPKVSTAIGGFSTVTQYLNTASLHASQNNLMQSTKDKASFSPMAFEQPQKVDPKAAIKSTPIFSALTKSDIPLIQSVTGDIFNPATETLMDMHGQETSRSSDLATSIALARTLHTISGDITVSNFGNVVQMAHDIKQPLSSDMISSVLTYLQKT